MALALSGYTGEALQTHEAEAFAKYEAVIEAGYETFFEVGAALIAIRDERLYRAEYPSFEGYVAVRWGFTRQRAYQLISAAVVADNLSAVKPKGFNERQARALAPLSPDEQRVVYEVVRASSPNGKITESHIKSVATVVGEISRFDAIDDGSGEMVRWSELSAERKVSLLQVNVTEDTFERFQRQRAHSSAFLRSSETDQWYTPAYIVDAAREVLGRIDLDPASSELANQTVKADSYYTVENDGVLHQWPGRVWMNPPYCGKAGAFIEHLIEQFEVGNTTAAIVLLNANSVADRWFAPLFDYPLCFAGRIDFLSPDRGKPGGRPPHGSVFAYLGPERQLFADVFSAFGPVVQRVETTPVCARAAANGD